jgi:hypothetical protein
MNKPTGTNRLNGGVNLMAMKRHLINATPQNSKFIPKNNYVCVNIIY